MNQSIEKHLEWLSTNPAISDIINMQRSICRQAIKACKKIMNFCKRIKKSRSCLWKAGIVSEPTDAQSQGVRSTTLAEWGDHPDAIYQYRCKRMHDNLKDEIAMEEAHYEALEILSK